MSEPARLSQAELLAHWDAHHQEILALAWDRFKDDVRRVPLGSLAEEGADPLRINEMMGRYALELLQALIQHAYAPSPQSTDPPP